jgi:DNA polymerase IV
LSIGPEQVTDFLHPLPVERLWGVGRVTLARMHQLSIRTIGDLAARDIPSLKAEFGSMGPHLRELANGIDSRTVIADWQRKSYGEESTFDRDLALGSVELKRILIAHGEAIARRLRADRVRARTITLKLKLARPLGEGRYPIVSRSLSVESATDDGAAISKLAIALTVRVATTDKIRLAGVHVHNLERSETRQFGLFDAAPASDTKRARLNAALDKITNRYGDTTVTRGLARAERATPTRRVK